MGFILGVAVASGGLIKSGRRALLIGTAALLLFAGGAGVIISRYAAVSRDNAQTAEQETAAYRRELIDLYVPVVMQRPWLGWSLTFPKAQYADSVDNEFLFVALMRGVTGLVCFVSFAGLVLFRLCLRIWRQELAEADRLWAFALMGALICVLGSLATVYLGEQLAVVYNILLGLADGFALQRSFSAARECRTTAIHAVRPFEFARVIR
jgi:O-antigen ligase